MNLGFSPTGLRSCRNHPMGAVFDWFGGFAFLRKQTKCELYFVLLFSVLGIQSRPSCMLGEHSTSDLCVYIPNSQVVLPASASQVSGMTSLCPKAWLKRRDFNSYDQLSDDTDVQACVANPLCTCLSPDELSNSYKNGNIETLKCNHSGSVSNASDLRHLENKSSQK